MENDLVMKESLSQYARRLKEMDRELLSQLPPAVAQSEVEAALKASTWRIKDESQLAWPGDLADDDETLWFGSGFDGDGIANANA